MSLLRLIAGMGAVCVALAFPFHAAAWDRTGVVRYSGDPDHPPFSEKTPEGKMKGVDADVIAAISARTGLRFHYVPIDTWAEAWQALEAGDVDVLTGTSASPERERSAAFTQAYVTPRVAMVTRAEAPFGWSVASLTSRRVAVPRGYVFGPDLQARVRGVTVVDTESTRESFALLADGRADACLCSLANAVALLPDENFSQLRLAGFYDRPFPLRFAVRKDAPELRNSMDEALREMPEAAHEECFARWVDGQLRGVDRGRRLERWTAWGAATAGGGLLFSAGTLAWALRQRRKLRTAVREGALSRAEAEERWRATAHRADLLERAFDHWPGPVIVMLPHGQVLEANPPALLLFGRGAARLESLPADVCAVVERAGELARPMRWDAAPGGWEITARNMVLKGSGEPAWLVMLRPAGGSDLAGA